MLGANWRSGVSGRSVQPLAPSRQRAHSRRLSVLRKATGMVPLASLFADARERPLAQVLPAAAAEQQQVRPVIIIHACLANGLEQALEGLPDPGAASWAKVSKFKAKSGEVLLLPDGQGGVGRVLLGVGGAWDDLWAYAALPSKLPAGTYALAPLPEAGAADRALLGWMLGTYKFSWYKTGKLDRRRKEQQQQQPVEEEEEEEPQPLLVTPQGADSAAAAALAQGFFWGRDLINTPAEDMGPQHMAFEAEALGQAHPLAKVRVIEGAQLLTEGYPAIHTVGRAAAPGREPRLLELSWAPTASKQDADELPLVALVGKGVCFDTGGLDLKTAAGMKLMKKDMGGGALVLALAHVAMSLQLPVRLRVLVPAVENAVSGAAYRPGDVLQTRAGVTVENNNTDAEGRLVLCDAIYEAATGAGGPPDVLIDAATLTGAARVALGPELPCVFSSADDVWVKLKAASKREGDPLWRLPLWPGYRKQLDSKVADLSNVGGEAGQAGAITAALFLSEFARAAPAWVHIDTAGWTFAASAGPGRPEGGELLALRALWRFLRERYAPAAAAAMLAAALAAGAASSDGGSPVRC